MNHPPDVNAVPGLSSTRGDGSSQKPDHAARGGTTMLACPENPTQLMGRLLDRTSQPFAAIDFEGRITSANRAFEKLTGYTVAELLTMTIGDLTPEPWKGKMDETLVRVQSTGKSERYEKEYRRRDGTSILVEVAVDLDRDETNRPVGYFAFVTDISERKKVETALRESEERFRRLYDEAPVGYHEIDTEGRIVNINRTECEMLGYTREEVLGRSVFEFLAEETREPALRAFPDKIQGKLPLRTLERTLVTRDGRRLFVSIEERYNRDEQGQIVGIRSTVQDYTERKRTEAALVASERRARALFEGIEDALFVHAPDGRILDVNPAASRLLGYTKEELLRMTTNDIDDPEFAAGYEDRLQSQLTQGHLSCEGRHRSKDGRVIPVDINSSTIIFDGQRAVLAVIRDITERKALEETRRQFAEAQMRYAREMEAKNRALTESEALYRQLTEGCLDAVVVADRQGRITLFNPAAEKVFGYRADEILGQPIARLIPGEFREGRRDGLQHGLETRDPDVVGKTVQVRGVRKSGEEFPLELSLSAVELAGELQFIGSIRDQTERMQQRAERQRMQAMLAQTEKLASIGLLSAGVAHEINNPLAYVANNLAVIERDLKSVLEMIALYESACEPLAAAVPDVLARIDALSDDLDWPYVRDNLGIILDRTREGVQRIAHIVQSLRSLARRSPHKFESAAIADLFESALEMVRGRMKNNQIELVVEHGQLPRVDCVPSQISQVILNLLINAVQAIESTGRKEGGTIRFSSRCEGGEVILCISDNGCGIEPESLPHLFDPFFTTKAVGEGTGLGLSISHGIITGHGGRIEVESRPGEETRFRIILPLKSS
ncbi:MAG: PAS domain S-box protein [Planctomycetaceae bacterium]|nr:PAS domain S-box protein [Planctomycetaceae bacterium]